MKTTDDYTRALIGAIVMAGFVAFSWSLAAYGLADNWSFLDVLPLIVGGACGLVMVIVYLIICAAYIKREVDGENWSRE